MANVLERFLAETHMSWIFFADDRVFKLKKPVRFAYLDFSTLARREAACRAELELNRRLQATSTWTWCRWYGRSALALGGCGITVDWLVVMRRLNEALTLEHMLLDHRLTLEILTISSHSRRIYRHATPIRMTPAIISPNGTQSLRQSPGAFGSSA